MNPLWFLVGMQAADRVMNGLRPEIAERGREIVRNTYWRIDAIRTRRRFARASRAWLGSLPVTERGELCSPTD